MTELQARLLLQLVEDAGLPPPAQEYKFHAVRRWRFDFAWPEQKIALEVNGGVFSGGRHTRGTGYIKDLEKLNEAQLSGWTVLQFTPRQIETGWFVPYLREGIIRRRLGSGLECH